MKIFFLVDWKYDSAFFVENAFKSKGIEYEVIGISNKNDSKDYTSKLGALNLYFKYLILAYKALKKSKRGDLIICWNFTTSIAVGWVSKLLCVNRKVLALNIIAPAKNGLIGKFRDTLFRKVLQTPSFYITVNSLELVDRYSNQFNLNKEKFYELSDVVDSSIFIKAEKSDQNNYVFCGGEARRDWVTLFKACTLTPEIKYVGVARRKYFDTSISIPKNIDLLFDIEKSKFDELLKGAYLVALPITEDVPAGLIVLLDSATNGIPIVASNTAAIRNYIKNNETGLLVDIGDYEKLALSITTLFQNKKFRNKLSNSLQTLVVDKFNPKEYNQNLIKIINLIS